MPETRVETSAAQRARLNNDIPRAWSGKTGNLPNPGYGCFQISSQNEQPYA
jgi:hypothetical protein